MSWCYHDDILCYSQILIESVIIFTHLRLSTGKWSLSPPTPRRPSSCQTIRVSWLPAEMTQPSCSTPWWTDKPPASDLWPPQCTLRFGGQFVLMDKFALMDSTLWWTVRRGGQWTLVNSAPWWINTPQWTDMPHDSDLWPSQSSVQQAETLRNFFSCFVSY